MRKLNRLIAVTRIAAARARSKWVGVLGGAVGAKCLFYGGTRIDRPSTFSCGKRCVLEPDVWVDAVSDSAKVRIGDFTFMGRGAHLLVSEGVSIGNHCLIGDGVIIADHRHRTVAGARIGEQGCESAAVTVGDDVLICVRAVILQGVTIGDGAIIGPGAVVTTDVPAGAIVGSPPGRIMGKRS